MTQTTTDDITRIPMDVATRWITDVLLASGFSADQASSVAWGLVEGEAIGVTTHGIVRTLQYVETAVAGKVTVDAVPVDIDGDPSRILVDAKGGYGFLPMRGLVDRLSERAAVDGLAMGGVRNSHHYGAGWLYASRIARRGMVGIVMTNASANLAGPGARSAVMGNNPLSIGLPGPDEQGPVVADMAMSVVAQGHIRLAERLGKEIPLGWARDRDGQPTQDASVALEAGLLEPIGGHKGFVLAVAFELIAGAMLGAPFGRDAANHSRPEGGVGHFAVVFDPERFAGRSVLVEAVSELHAQVVEAADGASEATMPGWREEARRRAAVRDGVPLSAAILDRLSVLDGTVGRSIVNG